MIIELNSSSKKDCWTLGLWRKMSGERIAQIAFEGLKGIFVWKKNSKYLKWY